MLVRNRGKDARENRAALLPSLLGLRGELEAPVGGEPAVSRDDFVLVALAPDEDGIEHPK